MIKKRFESNLFETDSKGFQNLFQVGLICRGAQDVDLGVGFTAFGQTSKKIRGF